jgi:glycosyltransferase involved in cell wall biosynthesis
MVGRLRAWQPDVIHLASPFVLGVHGLLAGWALGVPVAAHFQTDVARYAGPFGLGIFAGLARRHLVQLHNRCRVTYAPTASIGRELTAQGMRDVRVSGRGVDAALFHPARRLEAVRRRLLHGNETCLFLYVGRLSVEKNLAALGPLIASVPRARLIMVGDGPQRASLEARFLGQPVTFLGARHGEELATLYASADVFAFPSCTETFGQVVQEAMASGLPILAFRAGGVQDLFADGEEGFLCPPGDDAQWQTAATRLASDAALRAQLGSRARAAAAERTWEAIYARLLDQYAELAAERPSEPQVHRGASDPLKV